MQTLPNVLYNSLLVLLSLVGFDVCGGADKSYQTTQTLSGKVRGQSTHFDGVKVTAYLGIPYAQPPIGNLRFRAPVPVQNWTGVLDGTRQPNSCMQTPDGSFGRFSGVEMWNPNTNISEDCLYLNLWVPRTSGNTKLPVMLWVFGGSYVYGSITLDVYNGTYLAAKKNVIVASMQYRMGVHGFLYSGSEEAPGNMGLLDQQIAMEWIYNNVEYFGGDKTRVTLFGESSGAVSICYHLLANTSWPYFNNAIMLSGTALAPWAWESTDTSKDKFYGLATILGCAEDNIEKIMRCLRNVNADDLEAGQWSLANKFIGTFIPVIDGVFIRDDPERLIRSGTVKDTDILLGTTKDEGEFFLAYLFQDIIKPENLWNPKPMNRTDFENIVETIGGFSGGVHTEAILYTYEYSVLPSERGTAMNLLDNILGDYLFKCSVHDFAVAVSNLRPRKGRTYVYSFEYRHSANPWPEWMGVLHGYEIEMAFGLPLDRHSKYNIQDRLVSEQLTEYFTFFARTGSPNGAKASRLWPEFTSSNEEHFVISQGTSGTVRNDFRLKECAFWSYLSPKLKTAQERLSTSGGMDITLSSVAVCYSVLSFIHVLL